MANLLYRVALLAAVGLAGVLLASAAYAGGGVGSFVLEGSRAATVDNCVEPTEYMRRNHMEVIRHQRDTTVYGGIRSTKHSLAGCVSCHVQHDAAGQPIAVNGDGQFCNACHRYAAVTLNCFDCHATIPPGEAWNQATAAAHAAVVAGEPAGHAAAIASASLPPAAAREEETSQ